MGLDHELIFTWSRKKRWLPCLAGFRLPSKVEAVTDVILLGSKITVDGDSSCEIKRGFLLGRKAMTHLDSVFKGRDITLPTKVHMLKTMVFPVVMYGCESWTIKKTEH